jgi:hypothetical protein
VTSFKNSRPRYPWKRKGIAGKRRDLTEEFEIKEEWQRMKKERNRMRGWVRRFAIEIEPAVKCLKAQNIKISDWGSSREIAGRI